jgi:hypothetical protein
MATKPWWRFLQAAFRPVDRTLRMAQQIQDRMGEACTLHVRRGDQLDLIHDLEDYTNPAAIMASIVDKCPPGRSLYIASNEQTPGYFDPLKDNYTLYTFRWVTVRKYAPCRFESETRRFYMFRLVGVTILV